MNRIKALYHSRAIGCAGRDVYYKRNREAWIGKLDQEGPKRRVELLYTQLDQLKDLKRHAKKEMLQEARRQADFQILGKIPGMSPIRVCQILATLLTPTPVPEQAAVVDLPGIKCHHP